MYPWNKILEGENMPLVYEIEMLEVNKRILKNLKELNSLMQKLIEELKELNENLQALKTKTPLTNQ